jgi:hypothetical protein
MRSLHHLYIHLTQHNTSPANRSYAKEVINGFPLQLEIGEMEVVQTDCNADFMQHILPSLVWPAVLVAAEAVGMKGVPEKLSPELLGGWVGGWVGAPRDLSRLLC